MTSGVKEWVQDGRLFIWRYSNPRQDWRGWHLAGDPAGCRSISNLLDRMNGGEPCYRTARLETVTDAVLGVPNYGQKIAGRFEELRVEYVPAQEELFLTVIFHREEEQLPMWLYSSDYASLR